LARDRVRLMVVRPTGIADTTFARLAAFLSPGDLVVVNTSSTRPSAIDTTRNGEPMIVHFATDLEDGTWLVELRRSGSSGPILDAEAGEIVEMPDGATLTLTESFAGDRLWVARPSLTGLERYLQRHGRPITYGYASARWPITDYQTIFSTDNGDGSSAEMPTAARPFTAHTLADLKRKGIGLARIALHTGVSSLESGEAPHPERFEVPVATAELVNETRRRRKRVVAVGTTVTRALETVADERGNVSPGSGWTDLVLGTQRPARVVDGLITGWHPPGASHVDLLEAVAGRSLVERAYRHAAETGYLWHEFGDSCLFLPSRESAPTPG
jgi:S-adenosylmethionine:tRNA ribosyltransferase-isomerase